MYIVGEGLLNREEFLEKVYELLDDTWLITDNKKRQYYNVPAGFDIETSSFYEGEHVSENKRAIMYIWQFGIYNYVTTGRTWEEFISLIDVLKKLLGLNNERRLVVYVHNLPYEFQFIRKRFKWEEVFLLSERKPVYANAYGVEFRCSLKLSGGKKLEKVGDDLQKYKVRKAVGNLNYDLIRTPITPLSQEELLYCENDIRVILCYIQEKIEQDGDITKIPLTNTGYVRNFCRKKCYKRWKKYRAIMNELTIDSEEYSQLKRAFQGGFTHANAHYVRKVINNVGSHDFTSSYPAVMVLEKFPMSKSKKVVGSLSENEISTLLLANCCVFDFEVWGLLPKRYQDHPISRSKCYIIENYVVDNGRVVMAEHLKTTITEQDYFIYNEFYTWDKIAISNLRIYEKQYLPKEFILAILDLYWDKTKLKGVKGKEINYMISKNMINAGFGMMVTDPVREILEYLDNEYYTAPADIESSIQRYNSNIRRFLYYPWGIWVTAYARANLFSGIIELGDDYIYSDTDSVKSINTEKHKEYFDRYNKQIFNKIEEVSKFYNIPIERFSPLNKTIGIWDDEGIYDSFKTLGAKRYLTYKKSNGYILTLAGANKKMAMEYLLKTGNPFKNFNNDLIIPPEHSGRLIMTYIDTEIEGDVADYMGTLYHYKEYTSVHMEGSEYNLSMSEEYIRYLEGFVDFGE